MRPKMATTQAENEFNLATPALNVLILFIIGIERAITGENSIYLIVVLGLAMITLPLVEFFVSRKYI